MQQPQQTPASGKNLPSDEGFLNGIMVGGLCKMISAAVALGLSAAVVAKIHSSALRSAAISLLAVSAVHLFPFALCINKEHRKDTSRPPKWYVLFLVFSAVSWAATSIAMLVIRYDDSGSAGLWKRRKIVIPIVVASGVNVEAMYTAAACFGLVSFLSCLFQWYFMVKWIRAK